MTVRVHSGGQTGGDLGGLLAAEALGVPTGGWAPLGWQTDTGPSPWLGSRFGLREWPVPGYPARTVANVADASAVLIFGDVASRGCALTAEAARRYQRPLYVVRWPGPVDVAAFTSWCAAQCAGHSGVWTLDVAGNRERKNPGIQLACASFVYESLRGILK